MNKKPFYQLAEFYLIVLLFIFVAIFGMRLLGRSDLGYQIKFAELVLSGHIPQTDPFTFSVPNNPYICLNFFYDVLSLGLYKLGSYELLSLYTPTCVIILVGIWVYFYFNPSYKIFFKNKKKTDQKQQGKNNKKSVRSQTEKKVRVIDSGRFKKVLIQKKWFEKKKAQIRKKWFEKKKAKIRKKWFEKKKAQIRKKWFNKKNPLLTAWKEISADPLVEKIGHFFASWPAPKISEQTKIYPEPLLILIVLALSILSPRVTHASELLALIFALLTLVLNQRFLATGRYRYLIFLPLIQLLWVNSQATFMIGWAISGAYFLTSWWQTKRFDWRYAGIGLATVAMSLINPYTWRGAIFPFSVLGWFGLTPTGNLVNTTISEYLPFIDYAKMIFFQGASSSGYLSLCLLMIYIGLVLVIYLINARQIPLYQWLILITLMILTWMGNRIYVFLVVLTILPMATIFNAYWQKINWSKRKWLRISIWFSWIIILIYLSFLIISGRFYGLDYIRFGVGVHDDYMPVEGVNFIAEHNLQGNVYNDDLYGGWLVWHQNNPVYIMGHWEVMGDELMKEEQQGVAGKLAQNLKKYDAKILFFRLDRSPEYQSLLQQALALENFKLVYVDRVVGIWIRDDLSAETGLESFNWEKLLNDFAPRTAEYSEAEILSLLKKEYKYPQLTSAHRYFYDYGKYYNWGNLAYLAGENRSAKIWLLNYLSEMVDYDLTAYEYLYKIFVNEENWELAKATLEAMLNNQSGKEKRDVLMRRSIQNEIERLNQLY